MLGLLRTVLLFVCSHSFLPRLNAQEDQGRPMLRTVVLAVILGFCSVVTGSQNNPARKILEKSYPFPSPVQWKVGNVEVSLYAAAWGPADSPGMIAKGREKIGLEKPQFLPDLPYVLALGFHARAPEQAISNTWLSSGLLMVKNVEGDLQKPMILTPSGLAQFSGSPGVYDIHCDGSSGTDYWDFFPAAPDQKEFLFQAPVFNTNERASPPSGLRVSFRILRQDDDLVVLNISPGTQDRFPDFTMRFTGTIGSRFNVDFKLTKNGPALSGSEHRAEANQTFVIKGQIDSLGNLVVEEQGSDGRAAGIYKGKLSEDEFTMRGYYSKADGSAVEPFEFRGAAVNDQGAPR